MAAGTYINVIGSRKYTRSCSLGFGDHKHVLNAGIAELTEVGPLHRLRHRHLHLAAGWLLPGNWYAYDKFDRHALIKVVIIHQIKLGVLQQTREEVGDNVDILPDTTFFFQNLDSIMEIRANIGG